MTTELEEGQIVEPYGSYGTTFVTVLSHQMLRNQEMFLDLSLWSEHLAKKEARLKRWENSLRRRQGELSARSEGPSSSRN